MKKIKVLVGHPGKQHSLRLAEAILNDSKYELIYATTIYDKKSSFLMKVVKTISSEAIHLFDSTYLVDETA